MNSWFLYSASFVSCLSLSNITLSFKIIVVHNGSSFLPLELTCLLSCILIYRLLYLFPRAALTNYHKHGSLKQQKFILSQFQKPEIGIQGMSRVGFFWRPWGRIHSIPLPASSGCWESLMVPWLIDWPYSSSLSCLHITFSLCLYISFSSDSCKRQAIGFRAHSSNPEWSHVKSINYIFKGPFPHKVTFTGFRG